MRPSLSVCLFTNDPPRLVADALAAIRPVADEIVVAVDATVPEDQLGPLEVVADLLVRRTFVPPLEANLRWLHGRCTGDWILRLDGDQVPSAALVDELAETDWWDGITHASIPIAWLTAGGRSVLDQHPWHLDPGIRLFRNLPGLVELSDDVHAPPTVHGPHRILTSPIYELGLVLTDVDEREEKVRRYQRIGGVSRTDLGLVVNTTYYLPERLDPPPRTRPVPPVDATRIDALVERGRSEREHPTIAPPKAPVAHADEAAALTSDLGDDATVEVLSGAPLRWISGRNRNLYLRVTNTGRSTWTPGDTPLVRLGMQMLDEHGELTGVEQRTDLPLSIPPGRTEVVRFHTVPPPPGGSLVIGMVREGVAWFGARTVAVDQVPARQITISSGINPFPHLGDDLIAGAVLDLLHHRFPDVEPVLLVDVPGDVGHRYATRTAISAGAVIHRSGRAGRARASARIAALVLDARRMARGRPIRDPKHADLLTTLAASQVLLVVPAGALTSAYATESLLPKVGEALAARALGVPVVVEAGSVGPLTHRLDRRAIGRLARLAHWFTVRDDDSIAALAACGVAAGAVAVVPDAATAVRPATDDARSVLADAGVDAGAPYVILSLREGLDDAVTVRSVGAALAAVPGTWPVVFVAHCANALVDDRRVLDGLPGRERVVVVEPPDDRTAVAIVAGAALAVGTRFHQAVLAGAAGVPALAFAATDYDRLRLSGQHSPGLTVLAAGAPPAAIAHAVRERSSVGTVAPTEHWDPASLAAVLHDLLPPPPPLP
jgi:polysaccharide pyruvyl transferase WcaK-like protein